MRISFEISRDKKIQLQDGSDRRPKAKWTKETGGTGTSTYSGFIDEDYNVDWQSDKMYSTVDKMLFGDAQVQAVKLAITLPAISASWDIMPASDDQADQDIALFVKANLFGGMAHSWITFLKQALLYLFYGSMPFEKIFEVKRDEKGVPRVYWRKFATRHPSTIEKYDLDPDTEELLGIYQQTSKGDNWINPRLSADRLIYFINDLTGANYRGVSILRSAHKHWYYKDKYYIVHGMSVERHGVGIPTMEQVQEGVFDEREAAELLKGVRAHGEGYIATPWPYKFRLATPEGGTITDPQPMIEHHNKLIVQSILAHFLNLGQDKVGSFALSRDQKDLFMLALQSVVKYIQEKINSAIKELVNFNWNTGGKYPTLTVENLQSKNLKEISISLNQLASAGILTPGPEVEAYVRTLYGLPDLPEEEEKPELEANIRDHITLATFPEIEEKFVPYRALRPEERHLDLQGIHKNLNTTEKRFNDIAKQIRREQIRTLIKKGAKALMKEKERDFYDALDRIKLPMMGKLKQEIQALLRGIYVYGKDQVYQEVEKQASRKLQEGALEPIEGDMSSNRYLGKVAERSTQEISAGLLTTLYFGVLDLRRTGQLDMTPVQTALETRSAAEIRKSAAQSTSTAFNLGRGTAGQQLAADDEVEKAIYSAIMDFKTCDQCINADGAETDVGSVRYSDLYPPLNSREYGQCSGIGRCRCMYIYIKKKILKREAAPETYGAEPKPEKRRKFKKDRTPNEAIDRAERTFTKKVNFQGTFSYQEKLDMMNQVNAEWERLLQSNPKLATFLENNKLGQFTINSKLKNAGETFAEMSFGSNEITISGRIFDPKIDFMSDKKYLKKTGLKWSASANVEGTIRHELGHAMIGHIPEESFKAFRPFLRYESSWIKKNVSEYAADDIQEFFAEAFDMVSSPKYKMGTLPKDLEDVILGFLK